MSREILLTGERGFIGGHTFNELEALGDDVRGFKGEITNIRDWENNLQGAETVFFIAGVRTETPKDREVNTLSVERLFDAIKSTNRLPKKIIIASSQAVYMGNKPPFDEVQEPIPPLTVYGQSKLDGEKIATDEAKALGLPLVILRYSTVLGSGVREQSKMSGPLFSWTKSALAGEPIKVFQDGKQTRDYIHVDDIVSANLLALETLDSGIYNVGGGASIQVVELAEWIKQETKSNSEILIMGGEPTVGDPRVMLSNIDKIKSEGWNPEKSVPEAVREFIVSFSTQK